MGTNNASVTFNSKAAEVNVTNYANKIGKLNDRLKDASSSAKQFGATSTVTTARMTSMAKATDTVGAALRNLSRESRNTATSFDRLGAAVSNGGLAKAAGIIKGLSASLVTASTRMKSVSGDAAKFASAVSSINRSSNSVSKGLDRLSSSLGALKPSARDTAKYIDKLATALRSVASGSAEASSALSGVSRASDRAGRGLREAGSGADTARARTKELGRQLGLTGTELYGMSVEAARLRNTMTFLAGAFGIHELVEAADGYKLLHGRLQVVSGSAAELNANYKALLQSANYTRTNLQDNANMFTRLMIAGKQYNLTAQDALRLTENVNMALTISGATAGEAAAATQQLAQAFSSGRLQGDELRSVLENAPILAVALTEELKDMGVTMANLREKAKKGEIGINELMQAFANPLFTQKLKEQFDQVPLTIGQALTVAKNNIQDFIGSADSATGASGALAASIVALSTHLGTIVRIAEMAAVVIGARLTAALVGYIGKTEVASAVSLAFTGVLAREATVMEATSLVAKTAGNSIAGAFGGWVGLAITGVALAVGFFMEKSMAAEAASRELTSSIQAQSAQFMSAQLAQVKSAKSLGDLSQTQINLLTSTASLTGEVGLLATQWGRVAAAAKAAEIQQARAALATAYTNRVKAEQAYDEKYKSTRVSARVGLATASYGAYGASRTVDPVVAGGKYADRVMATSRERAEVGQATANHIEATRNLREIIARPIDTFKPQQFAAPVGGGGGGGGSGRSGGGESAADKAAKEADTLRDKIAALAAKTNDSDEATKKWGDGLDLLSAGFAKNIIDAQRFDEILGNLAHDTFPGLEDALKELQQDNATLQLKLSGADDTTIKFRERADFIQKEVSYIDAAIAKEGDRNGKLAERRAELIKQLGIYGEELRTNSELNKQLDQRAEKERQITDIIDEASNSLYKTLTDSVRDALDGSTNLFKGFFKSLLSMAKNTFASLVGAYIFSPIQQGFRAMLEGAFNGSAGSLGSRGTSGLSGSSKGDTKTSLTTQEIVNTISIISSSAAIPAIATVASKVAPAVNDNTSGDIVVQASKPTSFVGQMMEGTRETLVGAVDKLGTVFKPLGKALAPVGKALKPLVDKLGGLPKMLGRMGGGAMIGSAVGGLANAVGIHLNETGSTIGGAIGGLAGPLGALAGSIIGGVLGNLFKKIPKGSAVVTNTGTSITGSNSKDITDSLNSSGSSIQAGVKAIAEKLGGTLGSYAVGIGRYKDYYQVSSNPSDPRLGRSEFTKYSSSAVYDGKDAEEALKAAISEAIRQGAVKGVRQGVTNLITKRGGDMDVQLEKALRFQAVFDTLKQSTDPVGYALDQLTKQFDGLPDIFKEAGASAQEWADLQTVMQAQFDKTLKDLTSGLIDFRDNLTNGDLSYKSSSDRLTAASEKFANLEGQIAAGKYVDQATFTKAGQDLQALAREVYGSTPEFAMYQDRLLAATDKLISNADAEAAKYQPVVDAIKEQAAAATTATATTNDYLAQILAAMQQNGYSYQTAVALQADRGNF